MRKNIPVVTAMKKTKKKVELPLVEPLYSTYHYQGTATAVLGSNPSVRNWYLNQAVSLTCTRKFLNGFTTPQIMVSGAEWGDNPHLDKKSYNMQFLGGYTHTVIRNLLDAGYYVSFNGIDDFYVEGKSWYRERHFRHDGCICGYDQEEKTYTIYAYDKSWIYRTFRTPQKAFDAGRKAEFKKGIYGNICGIKPKADRVAFAPETALKKIAEYLDSDMEKYPEAAEGVVSGIVVHDYIAMYLDRLIDGSVPYEKMDRRVFRMIWEQKKVMLERLERIEEALHCGNAVSISYRSVVREADNCRFLYAAHHMKRRDSLLPAIREKLLTLKANEQEFLHTLLRQWKGEETT